MIIKFIEASHGGGGNWGKFMLGRFDEQEWAYRSALPEAPDHLLLRGRGWDPSHPAIPRPPDRRGLPAETRRNREV